MRYAQEKRSILLTVVDILLFCASAAVTFPDGSSFHLHTVRPFASGAKSGADSMTAKVVHVVELSEVLVRVTGGHEKCT